MDLKDKIRKTLASHRRVPMPPGPAPAAVLVPVFRRDGDYRILFTKRTENMKHHRGEISFPGGVRQPEDKDALQTALRETYEEVGVQPGDVEILGCLDDFYSIHDYLITPFVGMLTEGLKYDLNSREIERVIEVPLKHLLNPEIFRVEDWSWKGRAHPVFFYSYFGDEIWGVTAAILKQFLDLVFVSGKVFP